LSQPAFGEFLVWVICSLFLPWGGSFFVLGVLCGWCLGEILEYQGGGGGWWHGMACFVFVFACYIFFDLR